MADAFVHLHVHTQYSMLNGAIRIDQLVGQAESLGMPAVAVTDHGNMFGAVQLHRAAKSSGIAPILGCEVSLLRNGERDGPARSGGHLILLAASQEGYENLIQIVSAGWVKGLHRGTPNVTFDDIQQHRRGLVGLSGCMAGYLPQRVLLQGEDAGKSTLGQLVELFEPGQFYVELEDHGFVEQRPLNQLLVEIARAQGVPLVATNCAHFPTRENARAQLVLQCIGAGRGLEEMERIHHQSSEMYLKSSEEMTQLFAELPEAIRNTVVIAEQCGGQANPLREPQLPAFEVPGDFSEDDYLRKLAHDGLERRFQELQRQDIQVDQPGYQRRVDKELDVIQSMGFSGYFLIVQDFINWGKEHGVPVGPGRGSGAGSLVAYALRITDLDPIPYGLLFERFLNPERVSMPDFDIDFCMDKRDDVIEYVRKKYSKESVGQIATFHLLKSRSVVRDVGRVLGFSPADAGRVATLIPEPIQGKSVSVAQALKDEPRLKALYDEDRKITELLDTAKSLENLTRHAGMHAAGVVISKGPLWQHVPVFCPEEDQYVTQYDKDDVEAAGLVKFDFLGLRTLTVLDIAEKLIRRRPDQNPEEPFELSRIPLKDKATFALLQSGETTGVFQLESSGMQTLFKKLKPDCFEDIIAAVALYRPGPLGSGMVDDFVERKHGRTPVAYPHKALEPILKDTYGVIVYQEQVMQIAREMAGYSLGGADLLRRAMGKKKAAEMEKQKAIFLAGAKEKGFSDQDADRVFDLMAYFAGYGFNKSHSAAYALITYQSAFLKAHFPVEFLAATLTADRDKTEKVVRTVAEARSMGITVLPPDVNDSAIDFTVVYDPESKTSKRPKNKPACVSGQLRDAAGPRIRFGLGGVRGCGEAALEAIFEERSSAEGPPAANHGANDSPSPALTPTLEGARRTTGAGETCAPFLDLFDFCSRVDLRRVNKNVVEALITCGAFDDVHRALSVHRAQAVASIEAAMERGKKLAEERNSGQTNLFSLFAGDDRQEEAKLKRSGTSFPPIPPWNQRELLAREKQTLGFYVSGHPLDRFRSELKRFSSGTSESVGELPEGAEVTLGGTVEGFRERTTKTGRRIGFFWLEDPLGRVEVIVRPRVLEREEVRTTLTAGDPVLAAGFVQHERARNADADAPQELKIVLTDVEPLTASLKKKTTNIRVRLWVDQIGRTELVQLRDALTCHPGTCPVSLELLSEKHWRVAITETGYSVDPNDALLTNLEELFGRKVAELR